MSARGPLPLDPRRATEFRRELLERAGVWIRDWNPDGGGLGTALFDVAARLGAQVAERLDRAGDKLALGLLDWLAMRGKAALPARMPVAFELADNGSQVLAPRGTRLQVDVDGASVAFETEAEVSVVPGTLAQLVGVDAAQDAYYLPPPGLTSLAPLEPLPSAWTLRNYTDAGATTLQLDPELGLSKDDLIEIRGHQYRVTAADAGLVGIEPGLLEAVGGTATVDVRRVDAFAPFDETAHDEQWHVLYLGDERLFDIEAAADFEIEGEDGRLSDATWEYFGKSGDEDPSWHRLTPGGASPEGFLKLHKPPGAMVPTDVGSVKGARWIRAWKRRVQDEAEMLSTPALTIAVNRGAHRDACPAPGTSGDPPALAEGFVNSTALVVTGAFYPLGLQPRQFDTFYVGCTDAFSKRRASVSICMEMADSSTASFAAVTTGDLANRIAACVGADGALHLYAIDAGGALSDFAGRGPLQPPTAGGGTVSLDPKPAHRLPVWTIDDDPAVTVPIAISMPGFHTRSSVSIAVSAGNAIWVRREAVHWPLASRWIEYAALPRSSAADAKVDGLVLLADVAQPLLYAAYGGRLYSHSALESDAKDGWDPVDLSGDAVADDAVRALAAVRRLDGADPISTRADGMVVVLEHADGTFGLCLSDDAGTCTDVEQVADVVEGSQPGAGRIGNEMVVFWQQSTAPDELNAARLVLGGGMNPQWTVTPPAAPIGPIQPHPMPAANAQLAGGSFDVLKVDGYVAAIATAQLAGNSWLLSWAPLAPADSTATFATPLPSGSGPLGGAPTVFGGLLIAPGARADAWVSRWDPTLRRSFAPHLATGVAIAAGAQPLAAGDFVGIVTAAAAAARRRVEDFGDVAGDERFHALDADLGAGVAANRLLVYRVSSGIGSSPVDRAYVGNRTASDAMVLDAADRVATEGEWLLVQFGAADFRLCRVDVLNRSAGAWDVTFLPDPGLPANPISYWHADALAGRIAPYFDITAATGGDWDATLLDRALLSFAAPADPDAQRGKAFRVDGLNRPTRVVLGAPWNVLPANPVTAMLDASSDTWTHQLGEGTSNPDLSWEYWNGSYWAQLALTEDSTLDLKQTGRLEFVVPANLAPTDVNGRTNHWIRARLVGGDYGQEKVRVITRPVGTDGTTEQTVERSPAEIRPPLAVRMRVRYSIADAVAPAHVLTLDSGSLRDQSAANRAAGADVEAFVPLSRMLRALLPDGAPNERALLLGFDAGLQGEPVNVLLQVEERPHDAFAPLMVEALVADRFERVTVNDTTRALGESGLLSMAFPVKPSPRTLFGRSLTWLRLSPSRAATTAAWRPKIRGAYLNAAWATAAETLTREPLGSSDGRPGIVVQVARPPLLQDTLELRVREPLDDEERAALLLGGGPAAVLSNEPDLPGHWVLWSQVADPLDCGPRERVYGLDESTGEIRFGDGVHGMIPPIGRDAIVAFSYRRTEPPAADRDDVPANRVRARTTLQLVTPVEGVEAAFSAGDAAGGAPPESDARVLRFGTARLRHRERAVAPQDFADLALESSTRIAQARTFRTEAGLRVVVVMRGADPRPSAAELRELQRRLQAAASPLLGAHGAIVVEGPRVRRLRLRLALRIARLEDAGTLARDARAALGRFFDQTHGGAGGDGWPLGATPADDDVAFALAGLPELGGIADVELRTVDATGAEAAWRGAVRADELVLLAEDGVRIAFQTPDPPP